MLQLLFILNPRHIQPKLTDKNAHKNSEALDFCVQFFYAAHGRQKVLLMPCLHQVLDQILILSTKIVIKHL